MTNKDKAQPGATTGQPTAEEQAAIAAAAAEKLNASVNASGDAVAAAEDKKADSAEKPARRSLQNVTKAKGYQAYITSEKHTIPIDILVRGETVHGHWSAKDGFIEFSVPSELVEGFEKHYHFQVGNIVRAE